MKDKRLDVLLERLAKGTFKLTGCKYLSRDLGDKFCIKTLKNGDLKRTECKGNVTKCELED